LTNQTQKIYDSY